MFTLEWTLTFLNSYLSLCGSFPCVAPRVLIANINYNGIWCACFVCVCTFVKQMCQSSHVARHYVAVGFNTEYIQQMQTRDIQTSD